MCANPQTDKATNIETTAELSEVNIQKIPIAVHLRQMNLFTIYYVRLSLNFQNADISHINQIFFRISS